MALLDTSNSDYDATDFSESTAVAVETVREQQAQLTRTMSQVLSSVAAAKESGASGGKQGNISRTGSNGSVRTCSTSNSSLAGQQMSMRNWRLQSPASSSRILLKDDTLHKPSKRIRNVPLTKLNCSFGIVTAETQSISLEQMVVQEATRQDSDVTVVFCVRRPGCPNCMEHAQQLSQLASNENVALAAIVKERGGVADAALLKFSSDYFRSPIYHDEKFRTYKALGSRKIQPKQLILGYLKSRKRLNAKLIEGHGFAGEGFTMGGVLVFDSSGKLRYSTHEDYGEELNLRAIREAILHVRLNMFEDEHEEDLMDLALLTEHCSEGSDELPILSSSGSLRSSGSSNEDGRPGCVGRRC